jgi:hypothetical protein
LKFKLTTCDILKSSKWVKSYMLLFFILYVVLVFPKIVYTVVCFHPSHQFHVAGNWRMSYQDPWVHHQWSIEISQVERQKTSQDNEGHGECVFLAKHYHVQCLHIPRQITHAYTYELGFRLVKIRHSYNSKSGESKQSLNLLWQQQY